MDKWEKFLTEKQNDDLPESVELGIQKAFERLPKKKFKARTTGIIAAAVLFLSIIVGSIFSPAMATTLQSIPVVGSLFEWLQVTDEGIKTSVKQGIATEHSLEMQIDGHKLLIEETMFDGSRLAISFVVEANSQREVIKLLDRMIYKINDIRYQEWGKHLRIDMQEEPVSDGLYAGVYILKTQKPLPEEFNFSIKSDNSWVPIPIVSKGDHTVLDIQKEKQNEELSILYKDISFYPSNIILSFEEKETVEHYIALRDTGKQLIYNIFDENGDPVPIIFGDGEGGEYINKRLNMRYTYFVPTKEKSYKELTIVPTIINYKDGEELEKLENLSYTIDLSRPEYNN
ncbi:DUF4179 domain-containing protein [Psychrobacillus vulpis]|uniref:DUF4179 domain-containing protein n=1 Tax=Psychrobacillus vulpis TaxID=2325572 RepID=A0A544TQG4_9BACI|nr:DUF4179 domain-containing protein [Psychrobacillus vulpis]TQR19635.1 DUF4179 domain-containing protein [Psychrobacillus vulpis]